MLRSAIEKFEGSCVEQRLGAAPAWLRLFEAAYHIAARRPCRKGTGMAVPGCWNGSQTFSEGDSVDHEQVGMQIQ